MSLELLKLGLLSFWTLWISIVFLTNLFEWLKILGILPESWKFASTNYQAISRASASYASPGWLPLILFSGVILWQAAAVILYLAATAASFSGSSLAVEPVNTAFAASLGLWATFMLADEIFIQYEDQSAHLLIFIAQLASLISFYSLPA